MKGKILNPARSGSGCRRRLLPGEAVIRVPPVVPQYENAHTVCRLAEEKVIREGAEVGSPQRDPGEAMESLGILLDGRDQALEFIVETVRELWPSRVLVIAQSAPQVFLDEAMEGQSHRRAIMASPRASIPQGSPLLPGPNPSQHPGGEPRQRHRHHRRESPAASPTGAKPAKPGRFQGVASPPARCCLTFACFKITPLPGSGKPFSVSERWPPCSLPLDESFPRLEPSGATVRARSAERSEIRREAALGQVIEAWSSLSQPLKAAILAIFNSTHRSEEVT